MKKIFNSIFITIISVVMVAGIVYAGSLTPTTNNISPTQHTLSDIYNKISDLNYTAGVHSLSTTTSPAPSSVTLDDIYGKLVTASTIATPGNIRDGVTILGVTGTYTGSGVITWSTLHTVGTWYIARDYCAGTVDGSTGWRLPGREELFAAMTSQYVFNNPMGFSLEPFWYLSSTEFSSTDIYIVNWNGLSVNSSTHIAKSYINPSMKVRCVR